MTRTRQWALLTMVVVLAVLAAGWFLLVSPRQSAAAALRAQAATQSQTNDTLNAQVMALTRQARQLSAERARLALLQARIPTGPNLPTLIVQLRDAADRAGVSVVSLQPGAPTPLTATGTTTTLPPGTTGTGSTSSSATSTPGVGSVLAIPITVTTNGGFFQLEQFLANLENLTRSFLVSSVTVATGGGGSSSGAVTSSGTVTSGSTAGTGGVPTGSLIATISGRVFLTTAQPNLSGGAPSSGTGSGTGTSGVAR